MIYRQFLLIAACCVAVTSGAFTQQSGDAKKAYELYSWKDPNGSWNFRLLVNTNVNIPSSEIFNQKFVLKNVEELKQNITGLTSGTTIFWLDKVPTGENSKSGRHALVRYPPKDIIQDVRRHAEAHNIKIELSSTHGND